MAPVRAIFPAMSDRTPPSSADPQKPASGATPSSAPTSGAEGNWFGFTPVDPSAKSGLVRAVFDSVATNYDLMNDLMSGGIHRLWKDTLMELVAPKPDMTLLDVAGGTGDIAFRFLKKGGGAAVVCDITEAMVRVGRDRAIDRNILSGVQWTVGDAERLPIASRSVDAYTIAFGLRNVTRIDEAIKEAHRVLKPGGKFYCLEFSHVVLPVLRELYDVYSFQVLPFMGRVVAKDEASYRYLAESIRRFPQQADLAKRIEAAGFGAVRVRNLSGGIAAIHSGWRI
ncbi:ubiquinone biosynthesis methyltransferase UbiE [Azospirillum sp. TSO5]|nr:ubiquinone biosynthesis methyltransferase UbiE [Azospirillum sp. TSO5]